MSDAAAHAWKLIALSSAVTLAGSLTIYVDVLWNAVSRRKFSILTNSYFLVASLGLSSGVLITTALNSLLDNAHVYFKRGGYSKHQADKLLLASVVTGVVVCAVFNFLVHTFTSKSVVHCAHDGHDEEAYRDEPEGHGDAHSHEVQRGSSHGHNSPANLEELFESDREGSHGSHSQEHSQQHNHSHGQGHDQVHSHSHTQGHSEGHYHAQSHEHEHPPAPRKICQFVSTDTTHQINTAHGKSLLDKLQSQPTEGECRGFESIYHCAAELHIASQAGENKVLPGIVLEDAHHSLHHGTHHVHNNEHSHDHSATDQVHHHHVTPRGTHFLSIGLQTAFAITVHKLPEGFLLYATNRQDKQIGWSVFIALAIHNFFEGFTIACPLYIALENRFLAVVSAAVLGGGSQPLGALMASLLYRHELDESSYGNFGFLVGSTAGFMCVIALQMLCTAVSYGGSTQSVVNWAIVGILVVLVTRCF